MSSRSICADTYKQQPPHLSLTYNLQDVNKETTTSPFPTIVQPNPLIISIVFRKVYRKYIGHISPPHISLLMYAVYLRSCDYNTNECVVICAQSTHTLVQTIRKERCSILSITHCNTLQVHPGVVTHCQTLQVHPGGCNSL